MKEILSLYISYDNNNEMYVKYVQNVGDVNDFKINKIYDLDYQNYQSFQDFIKLMEEPWFSIHYQSSFINFGNERIIKDEEFLIDINQEIKDKLDILTNDIKNNINNNE